MSETTAPAPTPSAAPPSLPMGAPGPGATPPGVADAAPAVFSPETPATPEPAAPEPAAAAPAADAPSSILSDVTAEPTPEPEPAKDAASEPEAKAAEPTAEPVPAEPLPPPTYEPFKLPDGAIIDDAKVSEFSGMLSEYEARINADPTQAHTAFQELGQKLVDFHAGQIAAADELRATQQAERWEQTREGWRDEFYNDPEIGKNRRETSLKRMGSLMDMYAQHKGADAVAKLREALAITGVGDHPEMLRFVNWTASRLVETSRIVRPQMPKPPVRTPSQILYKNTPTAANGAA